MMHGQKNIRLCHRFQTSLGFNE